MMMKKMGRWTKRILAGMMGMMLTVSMVGMKPLTSTVKASGLEKKVVIDGNNMNRNPQSAYRGLGMVTANNTSRLLLDYKTENPEQYWEILNRMFNTETGMGLSHIKIEMGSDINSSSGTEPSVKRSQEEEADVTRGAGYQLAADALTINPDITLDMLWWSEPAWVRDAEDVYAARYQWYKETLDAAYETYGLEFQYVSANQNERSMKADWIKYLSKALKAEQDCPYDYSKIKIVASDEVTNWSTAKKMLEDEELLNSIDVISSHYTSWSTESAQKLNEEYGKELWFGEGSSPMSYAQGVYQYDGTGSGMSDINGVLDIATRIITMYPGGKMNLCELQPVVSSYYSGATYYQKQLIIANEPWSGHYTLDAGYYMALHFSLFAKAGWLFVDGACKGDGKSGGDGHAVVDSTYNYMTVADGETEDYSVVIANNTENEITYNFQVSNLKTSANPVSVWETRGPDGTDYYENYMKKVDTVTPVVENGVATYSVTVKPYSLATISTLDVKEEVLTEAKAQESKVEATTMELPYEDDFSYSTYSEDYLASRGSAPRYTTDQGGAFEVVSLEGENILQQKITYETKATEWGGTPKPVTCLGDDNWTNYKVSVDTKFSESNSLDTELNYVGVGARYILGDAGQSGYWLQVYEDGTYHLNRNSEILAEGTLENFNKDDWNKLSIAVNQNVITAYVNDVQIVEHTEVDHLVASGRVAMYSDYNMNYFDNLKVELLDGVTPYSVRIDETDYGVSFDGTWTHNTMSSFKHFNRTISDGIQNAEVSFTFVGEGFAIIGATKACAININVDGGAVANTVNVVETGNREASYFLYGLEDKEHTVTIRVLGGTFSLDAMEILGSTTSKDVAKVMNLSTTEPDVEEDNTANSNEGSETEDNSQVDANEETGNEDVKDTVQQGEVQQNDSNGTNPLIYVIAAVLVIVVGIGAFYIFKGKKNKR